MARPRKSGSGKSAEESKEITFEEFEAEVQKCKDINKIKCEDFGYQYDPDHPTCVECKTSNPKLVRDCERFSDMYSKFESDGLVPSDDDQSDDDQGDDGQGDDDQDYAGQGDDDQGDDDQGDDDQGDDQYEDYNIDLSSLEDLLGKTNEALERIEKKFDSFKKVFVEGFETLDKTFSQLIEGSKVTGSGTGLTGKRSSEGVPKNVSGKEPNKPVDGKSSGKSASTGGKPSGRRPRRSVSGKSS